MSKTKKIALTRERVISRLPGSWFSKISQRKVRRTKVINLRLTRLMKLSITFRNFRTSKKRRSKLQKQFVINVNSLGYKEISLKVIHKNKRRKAVNHNKFNFANSMAAVPIYLVIGILGILYFSFNLTTARYLEPRVNAYSAPTTQTEPKTFQLSRSEPLKLRIPKIEINNSVISVGLKADGSLDVPKSPDLVGWYSGSPSPGEIGPAVFDGHVDFVTGVAVFWRLGELLPGDIIEVARVDATIAKFRVDSVKQYPQDNFPTEEVYGDINYAGIRVITCSGTFDPSTQQYSHNTVVYGSLIQ